MLDFKSFRNQIYNISNNADFEDLVWKAFRYQSKSNEVYSNYLQHLNINPENIRKIEEIPFLPISFFKSHIVKSDRWEEETYFESSGTSGQQASKHYIDDLSFYQAHSLKNFNFFYGEPSRFHILALLPSYLERSNSSLVYMMQHIIEHSGSDYSGFYLYNYDDLTLKWSELANQISDNKKVMIFGITFALLELAERKNKMPRSDVVMIETGGMKGRRREMIRDEVHKVLHNAFDLQHVHSEYGMSELLSQAYSLGGGMFKTPPWMKVFTKEINDPLSCTQDAGVLNIIDLANIHSCCFIESQDVGKLSKSGVTFEVLGRIDYSDIRGCNLMWS